MRRRHLLVVLVVSVGAVLCWFALDTPRSVPPKPESAVIASKATPAPLHRLPSPVAPLSPSIVASRTPTMTTTSPQTPPVLKAGGIELPLEVEGDGVSAELTAWIAADLNLVYGHLLAHELLTPTYHKALRFRGQEIASSAQINFVGAGRYFPAEHNQLMGIVVESNGTRKLAIPSELVTAYESAWERAQKNRPAFDAISSFVEKLNGLSAQPVASIENLLFFDASAKAEAEYIWQMAPEQRAQAFGNKRYRKSSVLEVVEGEKWSPRLKGLLVAPLYYEQGDGISDTAPPMIFHEGRWKLLIAHTPN